ncbi:SET domain-containing protein [Pleurotus eryngii]|uniref:SET domain-containing protein n=1 Tax=Pleurotus eryngii TaxID=5323 RepID=A0A9P5ZXQ6_PLEER|nr:SET domain-containing protein [Pleurotus eryngii]
MSDEISSRFKAWFHNGGGRIHQHIDFKPVDSGLAVVSLKPLPKDLNIITCPLSLVVTPELSRDALSSLGLNCAGLTEKQLICTYLSMHWVLDETSHGSSKASKENSSSGIPLHFRHGPYLSMMPDQSRLRTSLHFNPQELDALKGSNLYAATLDRLSDMQADWTACHAAVMAADASLAGNFTFDSYLMVSTYLASRAFPSSILSPNPTLVASPSSYPVLLPGIDTLNHARGQPVTWLVSYPDQIATASVRDPSVSLVLHASTQTGEELFNNYGPKPNSEFILAYGFTLPGNPDDTIVLRIGGQGGTGKKWEVGRFAQGFDAVWEGVYTIFSSQANDEDVEPFANDLDSANMLIDMLGTLLERLPDGNNFATGIRPDVQTMISHYIEGQQSILKAALQYCEKKREDALKVANELGFDLSFDDDD